MDYVGVLSNYILSKYTIESKGKQSLLIGPKEISKKNCIAYFTHLFNGELLNQLGILDLLAKSLEIQHSVYEEAFYLLRSKVAPKKLEIDFKDNENFNAAPKETILKYIPVRDYAQEKEIRLLDTETNKITDLCYETWKAKVGNKDAVEIEADAPLAKYVYDPSNIYNYRIEEDKMHFDYTLVNLYTKPKWRTETIEESVLPPSVYTFFCHLFPNAIDREYIYNWIYHSITSRAYAYIYLCGPQGIGKNIFGEVIMPALIGRQNSQAASKGDFFSAQFNSYLACKSYIFIDEIRCRSEYEKNTLKRLTNDRIQIERKHHDAQEVQNHASYILSNNNEFAILVRPDDRRFSVPELATKRLETSLTPTEINDLVQNFLHNDKFVAQVGNYILKTYSNPKYTNRDVLQGIAFENLVRESASPSFTSIIDHILNNTHINEFYIEDFRKKYYKNGSREVWPSDNTIKHFFKYFKYKSTIILEYVKEHNNKPLLRFTKEAREILPKENLLEELM